MKWLIAALILLAAFLAICAIVFIPGSAGGGDMQAGAGCGCLAVVVGTVAALTWVVYA